MNNANSDNPAPDQSAVAHPFLAMDDFMRNEIQTIYYQSIHIPQILTTPKRKLTENESHEN